MLFWLSVVSDHRRDPAGRAMRLPEASAVILRKGGRMRVI
jgi:hypothetical protein